MVVQSLPILQKSELPVFLYIDLFCGAGGVTQGIEKANVSRYKIAKVIGAVNHDPLAIESHAQNHKKTLHFNEDIRNLNLSDLVRIVEYYRNKYGKRAIIVLWASMECTNYSKAKGGMPRDADSRTLPEHLYRYIKAINPDMIQVENVIEFMSWGPIDENGKPISRKNGIDYIKWVDKIKSFGYQYSWRELNSADYGAYTSRKRYFGFFSKKQISNSFPEPTHSKEGTKDMFNTLEKWKPVKEVLDFEDEGKCIFDRKKQLSENTLKRIYAGLKKYANHEESGFIQQYFGGDPNNHIYTTNGPARTITTFSNQSLIQYKRFLCCYYGNGDNVSSKDLPCPTLRTKDGISVISAVFLDKQYGGNDKNHQHIQIPAGTLTSNPKLCKITVHKFIDLQFSSGQKNKSIEEPTGSILTVPKMNLISTKGFLINHNYDNNGHTLDSPCPTLLASRKHFYLINPQYNNTGSSIDKPCFTLIARMDKKPPYLVETVEGKIYIKIDDSDSEYTKKIKLFMAENGISEIKIRMLKVPELKKIQGFPDNYILKGNQTHQKKFIGNSVVPIIPKKWAETLFMNI